MEYAGIYKPTELINALTKAVDSDYNFTPIQTDLFIKQIIYKKNYKPFIQSPEEGHKKIIKYIFTTCDIQEDHIAMVTPYYYGSSYFIDILFEKQYNFTITSFRPLLCSACRYTQIENYNSLHRNVIFIAYSCLYNNNVPDKFNKCLDVIKNDKDDFDIENFKTLLFCMWYRKGVIKYTDVVILLDALFGTYNDRDTIFQVLVDFEYFCPMIYDYILEKFGYDDIFVDFMCEYIIEDYPYYLFKLVSHGYKPTLYDIHKIMVPGPIQLTESEQYTFLNKYKNHGTINLDVIELFEIFNIQPTLETLHIAIYMMLYDCANQLMDKYNIVPEKKTLDMSFANLNYELIFKILNYRLTPDDDTFYKIKNNTSWYDKKYNEQYIKIINLLIQYGFVIKYEHIEHLLSEKICFNDLDKFGIQYDKKLYLSCYLNQFLPNEYISKFNIDPVIMKMHMLCKSKRLTYDTLKNFINTNNINLDQYSLDYLINNNSKIAEKIILECNLIPSVMTSYKKCNISKIAFKNVAQKYEISEDDMFEQYNICL
jgi:hypothetical protein